MTRTLPVEVWCQIAGLLPLPTAEQPWPIEMATVSQLCSQLRSITLPRLIERIFFMNPTKNRQAHLGNWVEHITNLVATNRLRSRVRKVVVDSRCEQDDCQLKYIDFLAALAPLERLLRLTTKLHHLELRRFSVTTGVHAQIFRLQHLRYLELSHTYLPPLSEGENRYKLKELRSITIRKTLDSMRNDDETIALVNLVRVATNLYTLHADEPVLYMLTRQRKRLPVRALILSLPRDIQGLLRYCPDLISIEFSLLANSLIDQALIPNLEQFTGPIRGVCSYVPGRPVHYLNVAGVSDGDQVEGAVHAALGATVKTRAFRATLATLGSPEFRVRKLARIAALGDLEMLDIDSDLGWQSSEEFARLFTKRLLGSFPKLRRLDIVGTDNNIQLTLTDHIQQRYLAEHRDPRLQAHWRRMLTQDPPAPTLWEQELAVLWGERCPDLQFVRWGIWTWERRRRADKADEWVPFVRHADTKFE
ncbi:hypothetical protein BKA62DRAFT_253338 [Auriculariales sp. MPI-PUGE-AT-0066]|nr:hypothetical protein BKA62DRAFT_253338 [Auriculariales sp. MPI-PUGE-AT-0066]